MKLTLFIASVDQKIRSLLSRAFDFFDASLVTYQYVLTTYGDPLKEFIETSVIKIEAWSKTPSGQLALAAASLSNPKLAMVIAAYQTQFVPIVESQYGKKLEDTAKELLVQEVTKRVERYVRERNTAGDWQQAIEAELAARTK